MRSREWLKHEQENMRRRQTKRLGNNALKNDQPHRGVDRRQMIEEEKKPLTGTFPASDLSEFIPRTYTVTVITRHSVRCPYKPDSTWRNCDCRKSLYIYDGGKISFRSTRSRSWDEAETIAQRVRDAHQQREMITPTVTLQTTPRMANALQVQQTEKADSGSAFQRHFTPTELAVLWNLSADKICELFEREPGTLVLNRPERTHKRECKTIRIPASVAARVYQRYVLK